MVWLLAGLVVMFVGVAGLKAFADADPKVLARVARVGGAIVLGVVGVILSMRGLVMLGGPLVLFAVGMLGRMGQRASRDGQVSQVETKTLRMSLEHDTGDMDGEVLTGPFAGSRLSAMEEADLNALLAAIVGEDADGAALLRAYMEKRFGAAYGQAADGSGQAGGQADAGSGAEDFGPMTVEDAYQVLGLQPGASADDIKAAHRTLMKAMHPDRGGSDWMAARINRAKDILMEYAV